MILVRRKAMGQPRQVARPKTPLRYSTIRRNASTAYGSFDLCLPQLPQGSYLATDGIIFLFLPSLLRSGESTLLTFFWDTLMS